MKKQTSDFKALVSTCIARINISMCRKFLRKARSYMLVYLHNKLKKEANGGETETISYFKIEKLQKQYRGHRDANCFDGKFIENVMYESIKHNSKNDSIIIQPNHDDGIHREQVV